MKWSVFRPTMSRMPSLPVRGAWIEIAGRWRALLAAGSLPVRGAWIEIAGRSTAPKATCRSPCGERGLKFQVSDFVQRGIKSLPVRGAWIEMLDSCLIFDPNLVAPRAGSVD